MRRAAYDEGFSARAMLPHEWQLPFADRLHPLQLGEARFRFVVEERSPDGVHHAQTVQLRPLVGRQLFVRSVGAAESGVAAAARELLAREQRGQDRYVVHRTVEMPVE